MPIDEHVYAVFVDGSPTNRRMTRSEAYRHAEYLATGLWRRRASDQRRLPNIEVKLDRALAKEDDLHYRWAKSGG